MANNIICYCYYYIKDWKPAADWGVDNLSFRSIRNFNIFPFFFFFHRRMVLCKKMAIHRPQKKKQNHHWREFHKSIMYGIQICHENLMGKIVLLHCIWEKFEILNLIVKCCLKCLQHFYFVYFFRFNLSTYPFLPTVPDNDDIDFRCDGLHDGFYASIKYSCQVGVLQEYSRHVCKQFRLSYSCLNDVVHLHVFWFFVFFVFLFFTTICIYIHCKFEFSCRWI